MTSNPAGLNQRQTLHRDVWQRKAVIRLLYQEFHRQLLAACGAGRILDIGSGTAHIKDVRPDVISTDILSFPGIDVVADFVEHVAPILKVLRLRMGLLWAWPDVRRWAQKTGRLG